MSAFAPATRRFSPARVAAMTSRYVFLLGTSWPRLLELVYWPAVQMLTWGFLQSFIAQSAADAATKGPIGIAAGTLVGSLLLWDMLFRAQLGFSTSFLEEMWSRNLANLMMSPLRPAEFVASLMVMSLLRLAIGLVPVTLMAVWFFGFNLWSLGFALVAFFVVLVLTSWSVGLLVSGLVIRFGLGAETFAWSIMFLMMPFACVYYPVRVLPDWLQAVSWCLPPTYVFEGFRALVFTHTFRADLMLQALTMDVVLFGSATFAFLKLMDGARRAGSLLQMGE